MNIVLIGFRCTGKTTVGNALAGRLRRPFIDADAYLQEREGKSIARIFAEGGEELFRRLEREVIRELTTRSDLVLAAGGGVVLDEQNVERLRASGIVIRLRATLETILSRMAEDVRTRSERPRLTGHDDMRLEVEHLLARREPLYEEAADVTIDTEGKSSSEVVEAVMAELSARKII